MKRRALFSLLIFTAIFATLPGIEAARKKTFKPIIMRSEIVKPQPVAERSKTPKRKLRAVDPHQGYHEGFLDHIN